MSDKGIYFLYRHIRTDTNNIFYVGIGTKHKYFTGYRTEYYRAFEKWNRSNYWKNIVKLNPDYKVEIILESNDSEFIVQKEIEFIKLYGRKDLGLGTLVNLTDGGEGGIGFIMSDAHKAAIGAAARKRKGYKASEQAKRNMSLAKIGRKRGYQVFFTDETRKKMSNSAKGRIGKLNSWYGKKHTEETKKKLSTPVVQLDLVGNFIKEFYSLTEAANCTNSQIKLISKVCMGKRQTHNNFKWKYKN